MYLYKVGTESSVLMSIFQGCALRGIPLYSTQLIEFPNWTTKLINYLQSIDLFFLFYN